ncbi:MAG TPA: hypothetical protein VFM65_05860 [Flavobacteriaceae bacterium]|nr:hypothetical protein [Flavobacteriaceae bacterium]
MKKTLLLTCLILVTNFVLGQDRLFLKNGTVVSGKITSINKKVARIKLDKTGKIKRFTERDIERAMIQIDDKEVEFKYGKVPFLGEVLLGKLYDGRADLYVAQTYVAGHKDNNDFLGYKMGGTQSMYYVQKDSEEQLFDLNYDGAIFNKFHNRVSKYFKDCPSLSKRIKNKELTSGNIVEIIEIYDSCE